MCGPDTACVLTARQLVRIRLSDATVEQRIPLPRDTVDPKQPEIAERLVASPDGQTLAMVSLAGRLRILDARTGRVIRELTGASRDLHALAFSPDGSRIVAGDYASVLIWRTDGSGLPERHEVHGGRVVSAEWSADGSTVATLGRDGAVVLLDMTDRRRVGAVLTNDLDARTTNLWATSQSILVGQVNGGVLFVDPVDGTIVPAEGWPHGPYAVDSVRTGRSGDLVVTADYHGGTAVWDLPSRAWLGSVDLPEASGPYAVATEVSPGGRLAATIRNANGLIIFDTHTRHVVRQFEPLPPPLTPELEVSVQGWTPDGRSILISRQLSTTTADLLVVDATSGKITLQVPLDAALPAEAAADPTGRYLAVATTVGTLLILDAKDGRRLAPPLQANDGPVINVSISPDGRYIATAGQPPRLTVWDTRTFRQVAGPLPVDVNGVDARARFAPDGRLFVTSGSRIRSFTINPDEWLARACREANRTLTRAEFEEVLPARPYDPACT